MLRVWFHCDRKRDKAKQCINIAWRTYCNQSNVTDGILKNVIGSFNPFCGGDKDPQAEETDQCADYPTPPNDEGYPPTSEQPPSASTAGEKNGVVPYFLYVVLFVTPNLFLNNLIAI